MESLSLTIASRDVQARIRQRLLGAGTTAPQVVWRSGAHAVLVHAGRAQARLLRGWLVVGLDLETDQTGRHRLELVYFLGAERNGDGTSAAVRINAATREAALLAEIWGHDLQRVVWDAVLDAIQLALQRAGRQFSGQPLILRGFLADPEGLQVNVLAGAL